MQETLTNTISGLIKCYELINDLFHDILGDFGASYVWTAAMIIEVVWVGRRK